MLYKRERSKVGKGKARVTYSNENYTHDWLLFLAKQPGEVWLENQEGQMVIVHEFVDLKDVKE